VHRVDTLAVETGLTGVGDEEARQAIEQRRFARAAQAYDRDNLAAFPRRARSAKFLSVPDLDYPP